MTYGLIKLSKINNYKIKNIVIFIAVSSFSLQALALIIIYGQNFPLADDGDQLFLAYLVATDQEIKINEIFANHKGHVQPFVRLVSMPFLLLDSFKSTSIFIFQWFILNCGVFAFYLLLKKKDELSTWLIIPISMLIFNPLQSYTFTAVNVGLGFTIPLVSFIFMIYFLNIGTLNYVRFGLASLFAFIGIFSNTLGLFIWPVALLSLIKQKNVEKKWSVIWILIGVVMSMLYIFFLSENNCEGCKLTAINPSVFLSQHGWQFFLSAGAIPFRVKYDLIYESLGFLFIFSFIVLSSTTLFWKRNNYKVIPWIQYGLIGLIFLVLLTLGRSHFWNGESLRIDEYYIVIVNLLLIGLIFLATTSFLEWKKRVFGTKKTLLTIIFMSFIVGYGLLLIPSYNIGWKLVDAQYEWINNKFIPCLHLPSHEGKFCKDFLTISTKTYHERKLFAPEIWNFFHENRLNVFANSNFDNSYNKNIQNFSSKWDELNEIQAFSAKIIKVNDQYVEETNSAQINDEIIEINGWLSKYNKPHLEEFYIFLNNKPFVKIPIFNINTNFEKTEDESWTIVFISSYLPLGCHELNLGGYGESYKMISNQTVHVCKSK